MRRARPPQTALVAALQQSEGRALARPQLVLEHVVRAAGGNQQALPETLRVQAKTLPCSLTGLGRSLDRVVASAPDLLVLLGEAPTGESLQLERAARNRLEILTARGEESSKELVQRGPVAYFAPVRVERAALAIQRAGVPTRLATGAGAALDNAAYYLSLHKLLRRGQDRPLVVLLRIPAKNRRLAIQQATKGVLALLRFLHQEAAAVRPPAGPPLPHRKSRSSPAASH